MAADPGASAPPKLPGDTRSRWRPSGWVANLALAATSLIVLLAVLELGFRLLGYEAASEVASEPSLFWHRDELLGWSHEPNASGTFVGPRPFPVEFRTPVEINSLGLRGPELAPLPPRGLRVMVLGDSLVAAFEVTHAETFVALTEAQLARALGRPVQMVNAGVRGYGTDQSLLYFRERGRHLAPDVVVYMQSYNDPLDNMTLHRMRRPFGKPAFALREGDSLEVIGLPLPEYPLCSYWGLNSRFEPLRLDDFFRHAVCEAQMHLGDHSALFTFTVMQGVRSPGLVRLLRRLAAANALLDSEPATPRVAGFPPLQVPPQPGVGRRVLASYALTSALVRQLSAEVRATGAEFVWIVAGDEFDKMDRAALARDGVEPEILEFGGTPDLAIYFRNDAHMNWRGHHLTAPLLTDLLERRVRALAPEAADVGD